MTGVLALLLTLVVVVLTLVPPRGATMHGTQAALDRLLWDNGCCPTCGDSVAGDERRCRRCDTPRP